MTLCEKCRQREIPSYRKKYCDQCAEELKAKFEQKDEAKPEENGDKKSFYVSYAKDIFIALAAGRPASAGEAIMAEAIRLVRQARHAF